jgi:hypothetical protein
MADRIRRAALAAIAAPVLFLAMSGLASAATFIVITPAQLNNAIIIANSNSTPNTINFAANITLTSALPAIASGSNLTINGNGFALDGASKLQIFSVNSGATLILQSLTLQNGSVTGPAGGSGQGGAVLNHGALTVADCTFSDNQATGGSGSGQTGEGRGGAIFNNGTLNVTDTTFSSNHATGGPGVGGGQGGAMDNSGGTATITNSTFSDNQAEGSNGGQGSGGAIVNISGGVLTVVNSTFSGNEATGGRPNGGVINNDGTTVSFKGTILASSSPDNCGGFTATDAGYNISDDNSCGFTMAPSGTSINNSTTLHLDPAGLAMNGGPTETIALEPDSEAVDFIPVASCTDQSSQPLMTDQRGFPRPDPGNPNFCDAGAFELTTMPFAIEPKSERLQIARSTAPDSDQVNLAFTFTENGFPSCDAGDDAFNGVDVDLLAGSCETHDHTGLFLSLAPWVVHTVNKETYGTLFQSLSPGTVSARMVQLQTPASPACGEWTVNIEVAGIDSSNLGNGPFSLVLSNPDGDTGCFDITNAIVGDQIPTPGHGVRRVRRR